MTTTSQTHDVINPATEEVVRTVDLASLEQTDAAIARASAASPAWRAVSPADRSLLLRRFSDLVGEHQEELALLEVENAGHTIGNARWEAGNVVVLKPAELTPLTAIRLGELALEAGVPEGVFTVVPGKGTVVGERFVTHPDVRKVCFTGSTAVGQRIMRGAADQVKRITLELGGKSANIVFADSDLELAAARAPYGVFDNAGQDCCARSRILVERSVFDTFMEHFETAVRGVVVTDPRDEAAEMGPLISAGQRDTVRSYVEDATEDVDVAFRGDAPDGSGYWYPATVVLPRSTSDRVWQEEVFGPVVAVMPFDDEADAIAKANDTAYGLSGSIWTRDLGRGLRVARGVEAGNLSVNSHSSVRYSTPFGGFKQSGIGRELGPDALDAFTEVKNVFISTD